MAKPNEPVLTTFQVNLKYINNKGQIRSAALAIAAPSQTDAKDVALSQARALYGETVRITTVTLW